MKVFKFISIVGLLLTFINPVCSADFTIRDKNYQTQGYIKDGKIYDKEYKIEGYIRNGKIYDREYHQKGYIDRNSNGSKGFGSGRHK
jgi:hypothetical protein